MVPVLTSEQPKRKKKQRKIRNSEYYDMQVIFDDLYNQSLSGKTFHRLMQIIESEENIKLAYRTVKKNSGSHTAGVDKRTIADLAKLNEEEYVRLIRKQFSNYRARPVRRVEIPKPNGKTRPLGIPTIVDRIVQQCILQVMEPICEAKFSENSNGFRPNRSAETAIAQCMRLIQVQHLYHVVDLDIKGFFDNISHSKLIRQLWTMGFRDKKLLCILKQMLKAPVILPNGEAFYPTRGTVQGGIISPLLANVVLNELDWWIASQWELMPTKTEFKIRSNQQGTQIKSHVYRALRKSRLKELHAVRYADDFKIFCASHEEAVRAYKATEGWKDFNFIEEGITTDVADIPANAVLIQGEGGTIKVHGCNDGEQVSVYSINGTKAGSAVSENGSATINTALQPGAIAIVKIGQKSVKVVIK